MASFSRLTLDEMIARVCRVLREKNAPTTPPYSLILGAGASAGVAPMTRELVNECIPDWLLHLDADDLPEQFHSELYPTEDKSLLKARAKHFWNDFYFRNKDRKDSLKEPLINFILNQEGLPDDCGSAYRAVFNREALGGFEDIARMRRFFRELTMGTDGKVKLNGTHFYLASLLALQPRGNTNPEPTARYRARRPFARTILTTNFDPLLQVSLQLVSMLYYAIDQPDLLQLDLTGESDHTAIQLVHVHGSIHRPFLANTKAELDSMRERHSASLAGYLGQHGVIVLGSGGWEDCLTDALRRCQHFPHGLYWLGRNESSLPPEIANFLEQHAGDAFFVKIDDASDFMARLYTALAPSLHLPELLVEPLMLLSREMEKIDLSSALPLPRLSDEVDPPNAFSGAEITPAEVLLKNLNLLKEAHERYFARKSDPDLRAQSSAAEAAASTEGGVDSEATAQLLRQADLRYWESNYALALGVYDTLIENHALHGADLALGRFRRGVCFWRTGNPEKALADYSAVIESTFSPPDLRAKTHFNRALIYSSKNEVANSINDYTAAVSIPDASNAIRANAFINRALCHAKAGEPEKAIVDHTSAIEISQDRPDAVSKAYYNRAQIHQKRKNYNKAISDYTSIINMPDAPNQRKTNALWGRAYCYGEKRNRQKSIIDYTTVIETPTASTDRRILALFNRGIMFQNEGQLELAHNDFATVIASPDARKEIIKKSRIQLGTTRRLKESSPSPESGTETKASAQNERSSNDGKPRRIARKKSSNPNKGDGP
ncbi:hypothetical protein [Luteolibacter soli]|uniref:SIR2-like domain-containing protein n=1 Tax=Luteolibacter soli TaxID=3135280 RepID=A0ABU9AZ49_9BACT